MLGAATKTDANASEWSIDDDVIRLRQWGTDRMHTLQPPLATAAATRNHGWLLGTAEACSLRLVDRLVSREHARLQQDQGKWLIRDLGSKNGLRYDGARRDSFMLAPGVEIGIGATTLIAESRRSIALHGFLARILGWKASRIDAIDHALRSIRLAVTHRAALMLAGDGNLIPIAHALHRHVRGAHRPFVACDPRRLNMEESVRSVANHVSGLAGFAAAIGGTLCVRGSRLPRDFAKVLVRLRDPDARVQLIVCAHHHGEGDAFLVVPIQVPPLTDRAGELPRIIDEYAHDAAVELAAPQTIFTSADRDWVLEHGASSLSEIEKATLRLVALRVAKSVPRAAERLGMAPVSLSRWIRRRTPPM
jgi:hypothetical protein